MTPRQILAILAARWRLALLLFVASVAATLAVSLVMFKEYTASATVMLDTRSPDQIAGGALSAGLPGGYMATQIDLINSERVGRAAIRLLGLHEDASLREKWLEAGGGSGDFEAWLAGGLQSKLTVRPAPVSNIIHIAYAAKDGPSAAQIANAFVKAYVDTSLEMRMERLQQYSGFFDERAKELRADLETAQAKLSAYQQKNRLVVGVEKLDVESSRLAELVGQLMLAQGALAENSGRAREAAQQPEQLQEVLRDPVVSSLRADLTREELRLQELVSRLGDQHPQLIEQRARVTELKSRLAAATSRVAGSMGLNSAVSRARLSQLTAALESQRARVLEIQGLREQAAVLQRDVEKAQRAYDEMQQRVSQSALESQNTYTNVTLLKQATAPMQPSSPNLRKNLAVGLLIGLMLAGAASLGLELLDRRLRTVDDLAELRQPLLVSLPVAAHAQRIVDTSRVRLMKQRVMTGLPQPRQPA